MALDEGYSLCLNKWALDKRIRSELGLLLIISGYTMKDGVCFASNQHLAKLFGVDEATLSRKIKKLEEIGYISVEYKYSGSKIIKREIRLTEIPTVDEKINGKSEKSTLLPLTKKSTVDEKINGTVDEKVKDINTSNIITSNIENKKILLLKSIEKVYGYIYKFKPHELTTLDYIFNDILFEDCCLDVVWHYKNKFVWDNGKKPNLPWLFKDQNNWFTVKQDCVEKGENLGRTINNSLSGLCAI